MYDAVAIMWNRKAAYQAL